MPKRLACVIIAFVVSIFFATSAIADDGESVIGDSYEYDLVVNTGLDNGYSGSYSIRNDDPHFGWRLGRFVLTGFTSWRSEQTPVILKNVGDQVKLSYVLEQDIDALGGNTELRIFDDKNGYDEYFGVGKTDEGMGRGTLIVRHTDYNNSAGEPQIYTNYLPALVVGAETKIELLEEGDYEVALDYEVSSPGALPIWPAYNNYRSYFKFKVRNGNAMFFLLDLGSGDELYNGSSTKNGFRIDTAGSHYLDINVRREVLNDTGDELVEDTRFNRAATDGSTFEDEGVYTVTATSGSSTGGPTTKRIYVGSDDVLKATVANQMNVADVRAEIAGGATVSEDGTLVKAARTLAGNENPGPTEAQTADSGGNGMPIMPIIAVAAVIAIIAIVTRANRSKRVSEAQAAPAEGSASDGKPKVDPDSIPKV